MPFPVHRRVLIDPPWPYDDAGPGKRGATGRHYAALSLVEIESLVRGLLQGELPLSAEAFRVAADATLFVWTTNAFLAEAHYLAKAWGWRISSVITWGKVCRSRPDQLKLGVGTWVRNCTEHLVVATRGRPVVLDRAVPSLFLAPAGKHSEKPDAAYRLMERLCPGPGLELFARAVRPGWTGWGDQYPGMETVAPTVDAGGSGQAATPPRPLPQPFGLPLQERR
jgi:N6-adenosine-specific RNA methylase IME4